ncbi:EamA family transporter [Stackebrandtia soli]|uniref:EamA family transporter n=1 Tax=Stackebrandtia soli TaxID=1892856 RepID=UPI0039ECF7B3
MSAVGTPRLAAPATRGVVLIVIASLFFGVSGPLAKGLINAGLTPVEATWLRIAGTAVLMGIAAIGPLRVARRLPWWELVAFGLAAVAGVQVFYFVAVSRLPVGIALLLEFTGPILVVAWIALVRRTRLPKSAVIGSLVSLAGLAIVVQVWTGVRLDTLGLVAGAAAAACQAGYFLVGERLTGKVDTRVMLAVGFGVAAVALLPLARPWSLDWAVLTESASLGGWSTSAGMLAAMLIGATALAYAAGIPALRLLSAPVAGAMAYLEVVVATVVAWLALSETLSTAQVVGGVVVLVGVYLAQRSVTAPKPVAPVVDDDHSVVSGAIG